MNNRKHNRIAAIMMIVGFIVMSMSAVLVVILHNRGILTDAGIFLGIIIAGDGLMVLSVIYKPLFCRCPNCNAPLDRCPKHCPNCGEPLDW